MAIPYYQALMLPVLLMARAKDRCHHPSRSGVANQTSADPIQLTI